MQRTINPKEGLEIYFNEDAELVLKQVGNLGEYDDDSRFVIVAREDIPTLLEHIKSIHDEFESELSDEVVPLHKEFGTEIEN